MKEQVTITLSYRAFSEFWSEVCQTDLAACIDSRTLNINGIIVRRERSVVDEIMVIPKVWQDEPSIPLG